MRKVQITLKLISPLVSFGEDKKNKEFRVTELKALLRSTFRELYYFQNLEEMKKQEADLFGSTEKKAPVSIVLQNIICRVDSSIAMLPHKEGKQAFYTSCFGIDSEITICFIERNKKGNMDFIEFYIYLLIQASIIGALGRRSRKGFGSFKVTNIEDLSDNDGDEFGKLLPMNLEDIVELLTKLNLNNQGEFVKLRNCSTTDNIVSYSGQGKSDELDYPFVKRITINHLNNETDVKGLLKKISELTHDRLCAIENNENGLLDRKDLDKVNVSILGQHKSGIPKIKRFASPVCISFAMDRGNNKYLIIKELNYNYAVSKLYNNKTKVNSKINQKYISEFINKLVQTGGVKK